VEDRTPECRRIAGHDIQRGSRPLGGSVSVATPLRDSSILAADSFSQFGETAAQNNLARLDGDGVFSTPPAPSSANATTVSPASITISWSSALGGFFHKIERSLDGVSGWVQIAELPWSFTRHTNAGLTAGTNFYYRMRASNYAGDSAYATTATTPTYTGYQQRKLNYGFSLTEPDTSDSDGDGISLILEYALGTSLLTVDQDALPVGQTLSGTVALSYRKYRSDVTYTAESSTDLVNLVRHRRQSGQRSVSDRVGTHRHRPARISQPQGDGTVAVEFFRPAQISSGIGTPSVRGIGRPSVDS
jgi:hypothetical protein